MALLAKPQRIFTPPDDEDQTTAIRRSRAELVRYLSWIHSHTLPILQHTPGRGANLIAQTDIAALENIIERHIWLLDKGEQKAAVVPLLDHIASSVALPGLSDRILAIKAVWVDAKLDNPDEARELLKGIDPTKTTDGPLLQAYMSIVGVRSHLSRLEFLARIIETSTEPIIHLQYASLMALELWMLGETDKARSVIEHALAFGVPDEVSNLDLYHILWIARAHSCKWRITEDPQEVMQAHSFYSRVPADQLNRCGKAALHAEIGMLHSDAGEYDRAAEHYALAYEDDPTCATCIYLADAYVHGEQPERARELLAKLDADTLPEDCKLEYWDVSGFLAIADRNRARLDSVLQALRSLRLEPQYFASVRDRLCLELNDAFNKLGPPAQRSQSRGVHWLLATLRMINQSVELKPNWHGIGLNLNEIIERWLGSDAE